MMLILKSRNLWVFAAMSAAYFAIAPFAQRNHVYDFVNAFSIASISGVFIMYYASVSKKMGSWLWPFRNDLSGPHYFVIGLLGFCAYILARHTYTQVWRWTGKPDWMIDNLFLAYLVYCTVILAVMHLLSRDIEAGQIPRENWRWTGIFVAIALGMSIVSVFYLDPTPPLAGPALK